MQPTLLVATDLSIGVPLPRSIADGDGRLLLARGQVLSTQEQIDRVIARRVHFADEAAGGSGNGTGHQGAAQRKAATIADNQPVLAPSLRIGHIRDRLRHVLFEPASSGADLDLDLRAVTDELIEFVDEDPDRALYLMLRQDPERHALYSVRHALHCAAACHMLAPQLPELEADATSLVQAALTMNIAMTELQGALVRQTHRPTPEQRAQIDTHPQRGVALLRQGGVTDELWLRIVAEHHEQPGGGGYPAGLTQPCRAAAALRHVDVLFAKLVARATRKAMPAQRAVRDFYVAGRGDPIVDCAVRVLGIFPPGTFVRLASGETAVVLRRGETATTPRVLALSNARGEAFPERVERNTADQRYAVAAVVGDENVMVRVDPDRLYV